MSLAVAVAYGKAHLVNYNSRPMVEAGGQPMLLLGGELGNSTATSIEDIDENFAKAKQGSLNFVLVPAYWELIEPAEGQFDFSLTDHAIDAARENGMKIGFLWFGAWKNSMSCYAPAWVKADYAKYPRARTSTGKPLEILSAFSENVIKADQSAFEALMRHISDYDSAGTVVMVQVENEIGMLEDARDHSALAEKEYSKGVPAPLMKHLAANKGRLHERLAAKWGAHGNRMAGSWAEVFGDDAYTDEYFMAWNYGRYVERLARAGKKILPAVYYVNAALDSRGRRPGEYPSAGPLAHLKDIWHAAAPSVDFLSPDIYDSGFEGWVGQYALADNTLFVPEVKRGAENAAQAYYIIGHHNALGISPFSIENGDGEYFSELSKAYTALAELTPLLAAQPAGMLRDGVMLSPENPTAVIDDDSVKITISHYFTLPWDPRAADKGNWGSKGGIIMKIAPDEYILAGSGLVAVFEHANERRGRQVLGEDGFASAGQGEAKATDAGTQAGPRIGLATVEEVGIAPDGTLRRIRTFNGDETHQGRHVRIGVDDHKIIHVKTYKYD